MNIKLSHGGGKTAYSFGEILPGTEVVLTPEQFAEFEEGFTGGYTVSQTALEATFTGEVAAPTPMPEANTVLHPFTPEVNEENY